MSLAKTNAGSPAGGTRARGAFIPLRLPFERWAKLHQTKPLCLKSRRGTLAATCRNTVVPGSLVLRRYEPYFGIS